MRFRSFLLLLAALFWAPYVHSQDDEFLGEPDYNIITDDPYDLYKLYLHFQPFYADLGATNVTGGFGVQAEYLHHEQFDAYFSFRSSYGKRFDIARLAAINDAANTLNPLPYLAVEIGGTYHITDESKQSKSKITLFDPSLKGNDWAATVPGHLDLESSVRSIIGVRIGGSFMMTTTDLTRALEAQNRTATFSDGSPIVDQNLYTTLESFTLNVGASMGWFRNLTVEMDEPYADSGSDLLLTAYLDVLYAPSLTVADPVINGEAIDISGLKVNNLGFRVGVNGKFNRKLSWGYNVETGLRPSLQKRGFFIMAKMSFPIFAFDLNRGNSAAPAN